MIAAALLLAAAVEAPAPTLFVDRNEKRVVARIGDAGNATHHLSIITSDGSSPTLAFTLTCGSAQWQWQLTRRTFALEHPTGLCTLTVRADGYKSTERKLLRETRASIDLHRLPVLSGLVIDAQTRAPIAGANVLLPDGTLLTTTLEDGRFRVPIEDVWPRTVRVAAPGRAVKQVPVPKAVADAELNVVLARGGSIALTLAPPLGEEDVTWEVRRENHEVERTGSILAGQTSTLIEGLDAGSWRVVVKGKGPLERVALPVTIRDGETTDATASIEPAAVELDIRIGDKPAEAAKVELWFSQDRLWNATVTTGTDGRVHEQIWQRGTYLAYVSHAPQVRMWRASRELVGDGLTSWTINVPDRRVRGRVLDPKGAPVVDALVEIRYTSAEGITMLADMRSGTDGMYGFTAVPAGTYRLAVSKKGYQTAGTPLVTLASDTTQEVRDVTLQPIAGRVATVVNARGVPLRAAVYVTTQNGTRRVSGATDDRGRILLPLAEHEAGIAFALPESGSIGMSRFDSLLQSEEADVTIRVPDGTASLEIVAAADDGEPIDGLSTLIRIDGVLLPPDVRSAMANLQGLPFGTGPDGRMLLQRLPPGRYEIWPLASREDYLAVASGAPPPAPVNVMLTAGHHTAKLKFREKRD
jgi:Carboxypeptidase regulatory-like domain